MQNENIKAVYHTDMVKLLKSLNMYNLIINKDVKCCFCGECITLDNIAAIIPDNSKIKICCNKENCYIKIVKD